MATPLPLKENSLYLSLNKTFNSSNFQESVPCLQGFVIGMVLKGFTSSDRGMIQQACSFLNDQEPFTGAMIAIFTSLAIESERDLSNGHCSPFFVLAADKEKNESIKAHNQRFLISLTDFAYGLSLGLVPEHPNTFITQAIAHKHESLIKEVSDIAHTDTQADEAIYQDDIDIVTNYVKELIINFYNEVTKPALAFAQAQSKTQSTEQA